MKHLMALRQRQAELKQRGKALCDLAEKEGRDLTEAEEHEVTQIEADLADLGEKIAAAEKAADRRRTFGDAPAAVAPGLPGGPRVQVGDDRALLDPKSGFVSIAEFAQAVRRASPGPQSQGIDPRLMHAAVPSGTHRELGADGYLVPPEFRDSIWERILEQDNLIDLIDAEPTTSNVVNDLIDESTPWGSTGVKANWRTEATQMTATRQNVKPRSIVLNELFAFVTATDELLEDAPRLENRLTMKAAEAITWKIDEAIFRGNGVGQPLGFMNAGSLVTVAEESGQAAATLVAGNVAKMFARLLPEGVARSGWWINSDVIPQMLTMTLGDMPIWTPPASGFTQAPGGFLFGRPVRFSEHCKTLGTVGDVVLMDPKGYYGLRKEGVKYATSMHLYFDYGTTAFRWTFRFGGQPHLTAAVSPANGSATKSHFVALATRS
jgi:HK97 family phage major capsid protein